MTTVCTRYQGNPMGQVRGTRLLMQSDMGDRKGFSP